MILLNIHFLLLNSMRLAKRILISYTTILILLLHSALSEGPCEDTRPASVGRFCVLTRLASAGRLVSPQRHSTALIPNSSA